MKTDAIVLDTSILSAACNRRDSMHEVAKAYLSKYDPDTKVYIPATGLLELALLSGRLGDNIMELAMPLNLIVFSIDENFSRGFRDFVRKTKFKLKPIDYSFLFIASEFEAKLLTFDDKLKACYEKL